VRVLLFTGKGGVGKTTTAAATALRCADLGHHTLVLSTDAAHSLADVFEVSLGGRPTAITDRLDGQQVDSRARLEAAWTEIRSYLASLMRWAGVSAIEAEELALLPGLEELFALTDLIEHAKNYDVVVVDCAATAETLRLLSLPDVLTWWIERLFPIGRQVTSLVAPLVRQISAIPVAEPSVFDAVSRMAASLAAVRALLTNHDITSVRLVVNAERVVVAEARRMFTYLALFGYSVDTVITNRLLPSAVTDAWFDGWRDVQARQLSLIDEAFAPVPVLRVELVAAEPVGLDQLRSFAAKVYGETEPSGRHHTGDVLGLRRQGEDLVLVLPLPLATRDEVGLVRRGDELFVTLGPYRRAVLLPDALRTKRAVDAVVRHGALEVVFADA
jgi:arsenite/tail-anchored protein-transporting ATPase